MLGSSVAIRSNFYCIASGFNEHIPPTSTSLKFNAKIDGIVLIIDEAAGERERERKERAVERDIRECEAELVQLAALMTYPTGMPCPCP